MDSKRYFVKGSKSSLCGDRRFRHVPPRGDFAPQGYQLTGSDTSESDTLQRIRSYGIPVSMGHRAENIGDAELVVYTAAVKQDNPELVARAKRASRRSSAPSCSAW